MTTAMPLSQTVSRTIYKTVRHALSATQTACCFGLGALLLTSCSSPPKPPSVDESTKRPVNARSAVDLKACQGDLSRASILVSEMSRASLVSTAMNKSLPLQVATTGNAADTATDEAASNLVAVVPFGVGSASWRVEQVDAASLVRHANGAALIMIRGRTDATSESMQETALARRRAEAAADFLQLAGVPKNKLRLTWQGAGDPVAGPRATERGDRAQSRRVEIEFYAAAPLVVTLRVSSLSNIPDTHGKASTPAPVRAPSDREALL